MFKSLALGVASALVATVYGQTTPIVTVDGSQIGFENAQPFVQDGRVYVPLREVFQQLGAQVQWEPATDTLLVWKRDVEAEMRIGRPGATINGAAARTSEPIVLVRDTAMGPIELAAILGVRIARQPDNIIALMSPEFLNQTEGLARIRRSLPVGSVVPVVLQTPLSSDSISAGTIFSVQTAGNELPNGTTIIGHVLNARPAQGGTPGMLQLAFDSIRLPDGQTFSFDGVLERPGVLLPAPSGPFVQPKPHSLGSMQENVWIGKSSGAEIAPYFEGNLGKDLVYGTVSGTALGGMDQPVTRVDVRLRPGTRMAVRLNSPIGL